MLGIAANNEKGFTIEVNAVDYLANALQIAEISDGNISAITHEESIDAIKYCLKKLDVLIGADYLFQIIKPTESRRLLSVFYLLKSEVGLGQMS